MLLLVVFEILVEVWIEYFLCFKISFFDRFFKEKLLKRIRFKIFKDILLFDFFERNIVNNEEGKFFVLNFYDVILLNYFLNFV